MDANTDIQEGVYGESSSSSNNEKKEDNEDVGDVVISAEVLWESNSAISISGADDDYNDDGDDNDATTMMIRQCSQQVQSMRLMIRIKHFSDSLYRGKSNLKSGSIILSSSYTSHVLWGYLCVGNLSGIFTRHDRICLMLTFMKRRENL